MALAASEEDFHLLAPGETRTFGQPFTLDRPVAPDGLTTRRLAGLEPGSAVRVHWSYENSVRRFEGGRHEAWGPRKQPFGGMDIPFIWIGTLEVNLDWIVPP